MTNITTLRPGEHFMFKGFEWVCLDPNHPDGGVLAIMVKPWANDMKFCPGKENVDERGDPMTLLFLFLVILMYDSIGAVVVMLMCSNYPDDATSGMLALVFWPLLLFGRIGIACYRIIRRLLK